MNEDIKNNDITFHKIFELFKKSAVRIVVYALVLAILGGGITAIIVFAKGADCTYNASIDFNYSGIENGMDPSGDNLLNANVIKSNSLVNSVLVDMGFEESEISDISSAIIENLAINGYVPATIAKEMALKTDIVYFPTKYNLSLTESKEIGFNAEQYNTFINSLMKKYIDYFKTTYNYGKIISLSIDSNSINESNDYISLVNTYSLAIANLSNSLVVLKNNVPEIYNQLQGKINILSDDLGNIEYYILSNDIAKATAPRTIEGYLNNEKLVYTNLETKYKSLADETKTVVDDYKYLTKTTMSVNGVIETKDEGSTEKYDQLMQEWQYYRNAQFDYAAKKVAIDNKIAINNLSTNVCTNEQRIAVEQRFIEFNTAITSELDSVNTQLNNYYDIKVANDGVVVSEPANKNCEMKYSMIFIVAAILAFVGLLVAMSVTEIKDKKKYNKENGEIDNIDEKVENAEL
ncbi:MAG: hypothetical protein WCR54_04865 [Clostridia bacterium]